MLALCDLLNCLSYTAPVYLPRVGAAHSGLGPPTLISNYKNATKTGSQFGLMEAIPQWRLTLSR